MRRQNARKRHRMRTWRRSGCPGCWSYVKALPGVGEFLMSGSVYADLYMGELKKIAEEMRRVQG